MTEMTISVADIREGDTYLSDGVGWKAEEDAETFSNGEVSVRVRHIPDGGISDRIWDNADVVITVVR
jgi:hypothetical protein